MDAYQADALFTRLFEGWRLDEMFPPVGSPPYVRRLRDQAAVAALGGLLSNIDRDRAKEAAKDGMDIRGAAGKTAQQFADAAVRALGYDPPGEGSEE
jgi:hypothetical protein